MPGIILRLAQPTNVNRQTAGIIHFQQKLPRI
jgi:hypothetical protein